MKKTIVILASILFTAVALFGNGQKNVFLTPNVQIERNAEPFNYTLQVKSDQLIISFEKLPTENVTVEVFNLTGKRVEYYFVSAADISTQKQSFDFRSTHPAGLYVVRVSTASQSKTKKFQM
jgi:hypothetical protein